MPKVTVTMSAMKLKARLDSASKTKEIKLFRNFKLLSNKELCITVLLI